MPNFNLCSVGDVDPRSLRHRQLQFRGGADPDTVGRSDTLIKSGFKATRLGCVGIRHCYTPAAPFVSGQGGLRNRVTNRKKKPSFCHKLGFSSCFTLSL